VTGGAVVGGAVVGGAVVGGAVVGGTVGGVVWGGMVVAEQHSVVGVCAGQGVSGLSGVSAPHWPLAASPASASGGGSAVETDSPATSRPPATAVAATALTTIFFIGNSP
jgi:hypothetical protein